MRHFLLLFLTCCLSLSNAKLTSSIVYKHLPLEAVIQAQTYGASAYKQFLLDTENATMRERMMAYDDYFEECNNLGQERAADVYRIVSQIKPTKDIKLLLTLGFHSFPARFITLDEDRFRQGLRELCEKYEMQLQCQLGFGDSRTSIYWRIDELKNSDGNLRILLDRHCPDIDADLVDYQCFARHVEEYTKPCFADMLNYNYTRYSGGRRIARIHIRATKQVAELTKNKDLEEDDDQFLTLKEHIQSSFERALREIAAIEGEKCEALDKVLQCVLPRAEEKCGRDAAEIMKTSILVGYLGRQRREPLNSQFKGFNVESSKKCLKLHPHIE
ncbi:unnamed protein product [Caenorhabditis bovis]|uniref:DUF19 domain-containing protein n=1 Tax=Caenorhabditis bovis TaxID=2654633 RepID=A0A8S1F904_9PELO|nr:unnamed protein product [Caenorhabditis bovis]